MAVILPESERAAYAMMIEQCHSLRVVNALIPEMRFAREWKRSFQSDAATTRLDQLLGDSTIDAVLHSSVGPSERRVLEDILRSQKHLIMTVAAGSLEMQDGLLELAGEHGSCCLNVMPWRSDPVLVQAHNELAAGTFGPNPQATFWTAIDPRPGKDPIQRFMRAGTPQFELANWLFGPAQTVSADLDLDLSRPGAIIATHPCGIVVHRICSGHSAATLRIEGGRSECRLRSSGSGWDRLDYSITGTISRPGKMAEQIIVGSDKEKTRAVAAALDEAVASLQEPAISIDKQLAIRRALEFANAAIIASRDRVRATIPLTGSTPTDCPAKPEHVSNAPANVTS